MLLYTAAPRAQFALRTLAPGLMREFAVAHDAAVLDTLSALRCAEERSSLPPAASRVAQLALRHGGLGLRSAALHAPAAFWASWADAFTVLSVRDAPFLQGLARALDARNFSAGTPIRDLLAAIDVLVAAGFRMHLWADLPQHAPAQPADLSEPEVALRGWQRPASRALDDVAFLAEHRHSIGPAELALLDSQSGPFAARVLTVRPTAPELAVDSAPFRVLLLRRLRLPLPLAPSRCHCQRPLDVLGDHVATCPRSGTLRQRGGPLERAAARVCREAGAAVATNVLVRDPNLQAARQDERRIEVIALGLPLWGGSQLAVDTTLVSPLTSAGAPPPQWGHRRRSAGRSPPKQGTHLPGVRAGVAVPLGRPRHRGWRALECGSGQLRPVVGSSTGTHCVQQQSLPSLGDGRDYCPELSSRGPQRLLVIGSSKTWWHPSPTGPAGTASSSHFRLDQTVVGGSGRSGAAGRDQHGARQPLARATAREPAAGSGARPCARPRRSRGAEPIASAPATAMRAVGLRSAG